MTTLIIDTSTERSLVAFAKRDKVFLNSPLPIGWQSSRYLSSAIEMGFKKLGITACNISAVAVTIGPGSFTGIRVGAAMAKGIAFARSIPLIGLCSLSGFVSLEEGRFASVIDARMGGAFVLIQEKNGEQIRTLSTPKLIAKEDLTGELAGCSSVVGPSFERLALPNAREAYPDADHLASISFQKILQNDFSEDLELAYLRTTY